MILSTSLVERFWRKVYKTETCWLWNGSKLRSGYGSINSGGHYGTGLYAHRVSWEIHYGPIPEGLFVLHSCDTSYPVGDITYRSCVKPDHLWLGTTQENSQDAVSKKRIPQGDTHYTATKPELIVRGERRAVKLSDELVVDLRTLWLQGWKQDALAAKFGITQGTVSEIVNGKLWTHLLP